MSKWEAKKIEEVADLCLGKMLDKEKNKGEYHPYLANINVRWGYFDLSNLGQMRFEENEQERFGLQFGDLVICEGGEPGRCALWKSEIPNMKIQKALHRVRVKKGYSNEFLYFRFLLARKEGNLTNHFIGSTIKHLTGKGLSQVKFTFPSYSEQLKIATVLSTLEAKIELNNRINAELEAMAKTLYDYWFVQFDFPITEEQAKAMGKPELKGKPYKSSGGSMVWNEELKREVPEGWEVTTMAEWIDINKSGDWGKENAEGNFTKKVICFRGADINGLNGLAELKPPVRFILEKNASKILKSHDIIIEISGGSPTQSTGRMAYITDATINRFEYPLVCSNFCKPISIKNKKLLYNFVYYWNSLYDNGVFFGYEGKTSGIKNLLLDSFVSSYYTVVPDEIIATQFYDFMDKIQKKKQTTLTENQHLTSLRDWLLPMLMNGQVTVRQAHGIAIKEVEEALAMVAEERSEYKTKK